MGVEVSGKPVDVVNYFIETSPSVSFPHPKRVYSAGDNSSRFEWLKKCFPNERCTVLQFDVNNETGVDTEPKDPNENLVMNHKLSVAYRGYNLRPREELTGLVWDHRDTIKNSDEIYDLEHKSGEDLIVAVDSRTYLQKNEALESVGKPTSHAEIKNHFKDILESALKNNKVPEYEVRSASGVVYVDKDLTPHYVGKKSSCKIYLHTEKLKELTTDEGFKSYIDRTSVFFGNNEKILNNSAGFSLEVLVQMGVVSGLQFPDGDVSSREETSFKNTLKRAVQLVAIGTAPELMGLFEGVNPTSVVNEWDFLEDTTSKALGGVIT